MTNTALLLSSVNGGAHYPTKKKFSPRKADNRSIHGWLEAMKESSPPRVRHLHMDASATLETEPMDIPYKRWKASHPSALDNFNKVLEAAVGKNVFVFLDYDGTLSPIVEDPERAFMSDEMRSAVKETAALFPTAIITGRCRDKVYGFVQLPELYYAGSHGMDIMGPAEDSNGVKANGTKTLDEEGNEVVLFQPASEFTLVMDEIFKLLEEKASKVPGARVEHNKYCVSVHFRCVKEENWLHLAEQVLCISKSYPNLYLTQGRKVLEIRPSISWNKGKALDFLIRTLGHGNKNDVFPIYIGDDQTDEDAFKVVARRKHGLPILVSNVVKDTNASCSLRNPTQVLEFLQLLVKWRAVSAKP
ncbi:hypothetical protein GOP47_0017909 [Adiantum capillus-veneris]|uniref:Trehalose 6-phosphate phosphatase n=1 Tax=Adiantum capillus-veneris TaxID=13818 RepID=A0A9D4UHF6_ADICA|nr:hypothetical protein GOP47_0017909 [Adiantum capillus-veneris]